MIYANILFIFWILRSVLLPFFTRVLHRVSRYLATGKRARKLFNTAQILLASEQTLR